MGKVIPSAYRQGTMTRSNLARQLKNYAAYKLKVNLQNALENRFKRSRTRTRTRTKRKKRRNNLHVMHGTAYSKHVVFWKPKRYVKTLIKQAGWYTAQWDNSANLKPAPTYSTGVQAFQSPMIPILNPWFARYKTSVNDEGQLRDVYIKSIKVRFMITNQTTANTMVSLYSFYAKKDLDNSDITNQPFGHWGDGLANMGTSFGYLHPSNSPMLSKKCRELWGVEKKWIWNLQGGETITVDYIYCPNRIIKGQTIHELVPQSGSTYSQCGSFRGLTRYLGVIAHGTPVESSSVSDNITTSEVQCPWTASLEITSTTIAHMSEKLATVSYQPLDIATYKNVQPGDQEVANVVIP